MKISAVNQTNKIARRKGNPTEMNFQWDFNSVGGKYYKRLLLQQPL
jgi:hypothetical protein